MAEREPSAENVASFRMFPASSTSWRAEMLGSASWHVACRLAPFPKSTWCQATRKLQGRRAPRASHTRPRLALGFHTCSLLPTWPACSSMLHPFLGMSVNMGGRTWLSVPARVSRAPTASVAHDKRMPNLSIGHGEHVGTCSGLSGLHWPGFFSMKFLTETLTRWLGRGGADLRAKVYENL